MLVSCRTHYFRSTFDQKSYLSNARSGKGDSSFLTIELLPFNQAQIQEYLDKRFGVDKSAAVFDRLESIHNLLDLSARPMLLDLISQLIESGAINRLAGRSDSLGTSALYHELANHSLSRDLGKHTVATRHKLEIMSSMAGELAVLGQRDWSVEAMERWIDSYFNNSDLHITYTNKERDIIHEDIRAASFLVRSGNRFRFSHTSFFEYFLALRLVAGADTDKLDGWQISHPGQETFAFVNELLSDNQRQHLVRYLGEARDSEQDRAKQTLALQWWLAQPSYAGFIPQKIHLRKLALHYYQWFGQEQQLLPLAGAIFDHCALIGSDWRFVDCQRAQFVDCQLDGSHWQLTRTEDATFSNCSGDYAKGRRLPTHPPFLPSAGPRPQAARLLSTIGHRSAITSCTFSPDGSQILSASDDNTVKLWNAADASCLQTFTGHDNGVNSCAFSPDGSQILSASSDNTVKLWNAADASCLQTFTGHSDWVRGCAFSPDGSQILSASDDKTVKLWNAADASCLQTFTGHDNGVNSCAFSPDGSQILSASDDKTVKLWNAADASCLQTFTGHSDWVRGCAFSPDGSQILSASADNTVKLWNAADASCLQTFTGHDNEVNSCAFSPDGSQILSASDDNTVKLWNAADASCLQTFTGHSQRVWSCAFSPDGSQILSASSDNTVKLWNAADASCLQTFTGHSDWVRGCAFSPDGSQILSASDDKTVKLWNAADASCLQTFTGHVQRGK